MAVRLRDKENVDAPASPFIYGNVRDNPGDGTGTPANKATFADYLQFFERLMDIAGVIFNGLPENLSNGFQYADALTAYITSFIAGARYEWESADALKADIAQSAWVNITLKNSWTNHSGTHLKYRFDNFGRVHLSGCVANAGGSPASAIATTPAALASLPCFATGVVVALVAANIGSNIPIYVTIDSSNISLLQGNSTPSTSTGYILDGLGFWPDENV